VALFLALSHAPMNTIIGNKDARHRNNNRLYGGGFPSKCLDKFVVPGLNARSNVLQILSFPLPNCGTPHLAPSPPRVSEHSAVPSRYCVHSCALFIVVVRFSRYVQYWSSMTDKKRQYSAKNRCPLWWALIIMQNVQTLSDITMSSPRPRTLAILLMWSRCSSLSSHWC
jgi:hypothetical protein